MALFTRYPERTGPGALAPNDDRPGWRQAIADAEDVHAQLDPKLSRKLSPVEVEAVITAIGAARDAKIRSAAEERRRLTERMLERNRLEREHRPVRTAIALLLEDEDLPVEVQRRIVSAFASQAAIEVTGEVVGPADLSGSGDDVAIVAEDRLARGWHPGLHVLAIDAVPSPRPAETLRPDSRITIRGKSEPYRAPVEVEVPAHA